MVYEDYEYIKNLIKKGIIQSPCLELGAGLEGVNCKELIGRANIKYFGADLHAANCVDYVANFEQAEVVKKTFSGVEQFKSVVVCNILEHTFNPIRVLDNIFTILQSGGTCIIIVPSVWPIHNYPKDYYRFNPDFFEEYCKRNNLQLLKEYFVFISRKNVFEIKNKTGQYDLPKPSESTYQWFKSRIIHKLFNTFGRGMFFPSHVGLGAVIKK